MADIPGSVTLTGFIAPTDTADTYATHDDEYGRGGHRSVADLSARDAIPTLRRKEGMQVFVLSEGIAYRLFGGVSNSDWVEASSTAREASTSLIAGENLAPYRAVLVRSDGKAYYADKGTASERDNVIGIVKAAASINDLVEIYTAGTVTNPAWNWTPGPVYVNTSGTLTQTEPTTGYVVKVGVATASTKLLIDIDKVGYVEIEYDSVDGGTF